MKNLIKQLQNKNLIARITKVDDKYNVYVVQVCNTGIQIIEDYFDLKTRVSTYNRAEKWAKKVIAIYN